MCLSRTDFDQRSLSNRGGEGCGSEEINCTEATKIASEMFSPHISCYTTQRFNVNFT
jgi:hypothetical protein